MCVAVGLAWVPGVLCGTWERRSVLLSGGRVVSSVNVFFSPDAFHEIDKLRVDRLEALALLRQQRVDIGRATEDAFQIHLRTKPRKTNEGTGARSHTHALSARQSTHRQRRITQKVNRSVPNDVARQSKRQTCHECD